MDEELDSILNRVQARCQLEESCAARVLPATACMVLSEFRPGLLAVVCALQMSRFGRQGNTCTYRGHCIVCAPCESESDRQKPKFKVNWALGKTSDGRWGQVQVLWGTWALTQADRRRAASVCMLGLWPESNSAVERRTLISLQHGLLFSRSPAARAACALVAETSEQHLTPSSPAAQVPWSHESAGRNKAIHARSPDPAIGTMEPL
ncbi:hypothetical protein DHEL01_v200477 [Diaporthe helianthi]|uniref:Uncharacterized protein n=1 Tax=Diaporthe helianthi TaxID=158607 RepID=A0A2P5IF26_DIAHE|nr:hypothetical protein DHEL01_v200477 [Diaporthe helianthi]